MPKSDVDRLDAFVLGGESFTVVRRSARKMKGVKRQVRRAHGFGQIGAALEAVVLVVLSEADRDRREKVIEEDPELGSFPVLRGMASWIAEALGDDELGRLIEKACGRLDARVDKINERRDALVQRALDQINERHDTLTRRALQRSLGPLDSPQIRQVENARPTPSPLRCSWGRSQIARVPRRRRPVRRVAGSRDGPGREPPEPDPLAQRGRR